MLNVILAGFLFCFILIVCFLFLCLGVYIGTRLKKTPPAEPLTEEQEREIKKKQREMENFWKYDGTKQG